MKSYKTEPRVKRNNVRGTIESNVRVWLQLPQATVTVALGKPTMENKVRIPEAWEVGHLPVFFGWNGNSLCLTDLTEIELDQLVVAFNKAINAARPVCKILDDRAFEAMQSGAELDAIPKRVLRGAAPQLVRDIDTILPTDPYDEDLNEPDQVSSLD